MKTYIKKSLVLRVLVAVVGVLMARWSQAQFNYTTDNGTVTITGYTGSGGAVVIPDTINGLPVTSIGVRAFASGTNLISLNIPSSVISIAAEALTDCSSLTNITVDDLNPSYGSADGVLFNKALTTLIQCPGGKSGTYLVPQGVTNIGNRAFSDCGSLTSVTNPSGLVTIGDYAFWACTSLTNLTIPEGLTSLGQAAFFFCNSLTSMTMPKSLVVIGPSAFFDCSVLANMTIPSGVTNIGDEAFSGCISLTNITVDALDPTYGGTGGALFNKTLTALIEYPCGKTGSYAIPTSVTMIGAYAFFDGSLTSVTISSNVTSIGDEAFGRCFSLSSVNIASGVTNIGVSAFSACTSLASVTIPRGVTTIGQGAFSNCTGLTNVTIPSSVTSIGKDAFFNCISLTDLIVEAPNPAFTSIAGVLFNKALTMLIQFPAGKTGSYIIPITVTSIADRAFAFCGLTNLTIPGSVSSLGNGTFEWCTNLGGVFFTGNPPSLGGPSLFFKDDAAIVYYLPGTTGWGATFNGLSVVLWNPVVQTSSPNFGVRTNRFGFDIIGNPGIPIVVEACSSLVNPAWVSLRSLNVTNGRVYFSDGDWTNYQARFYRIRTP